MAEHQGGSSSRSVLLVDDDLLLLDALERSFKSAEELQVVASGSFPEARRTLRTSQFDVLITDVRLGEFNGLQLAHLAREKNPQVQIIVFSGFDDPVLRQEAERLGAVYLVKPVTSSYLVELIRTRAE
jgi:two-component system response regulator YesN